MPLALREGFGTPREIISKRNAVHEFGSASVHARVNLVDTVKLSEPFMASFRVSHCHKPSRASVAKPGGQNSLNLRQVVSYVLAMS